jgi:sialic acid synthase SpsE
MKTISINGRSIGYNKEPFIIAEVGINHNGDVEIAKKMIQVAKDSGVDAVKFQTFHAKEFISNDKETYTYISQGVETTESMLKMFERHEFSRTEWKQIKDFCDEQQITFLSTPQNETDLDILLPLGIEAIKIGSDDFINIPLVK